MRARTLGLILAVMLSGGFSVAELGHVTDTVDGGGARVSTANYTLQGSLGGLTGVSTGGSPPAATRAGYVGQLTEVFGLSVTGTPTAVAEETTSQLSGTATLDDGTTSLLTGTDIHWTIVSGPLAAIDATGVATLASVYTNTPALARGFYLGASNLVTLTVLDINPDNYRDYAGDGLPDGWQVVHFGAPPNAAAAPGGDPDGDGQNNQFEYVAGVDPGDSTSHFRLRLETVAGQPAQQKLIFSPRSTERTYTPQFSSNLMSGVYQALTEVAVSDSGQERTVTDLQATESNKFYRIQISLP